ncbi:hypothetical protein ATO50_09390 [Aeromonas hydrophila]|nr:hypothetical protein ATO50_09390 [Aeromonas hydrophila]
MHDDLIYNTTWMMLAEVTYTNSSLHPTQAATFNTMCGGKHPVLINQSATAVIIPLIVNMITNGDHPAWCLNRRTTDNTVGGTFLSIGIGCQ